MEWNYKNPVFRSTGLAEPIILMYYGLRADVAIIVKEVSTSPPEWTDNAIESND